MSKKKASAINRQFAIIFEMIGIAWLAVSALQGYSFSVSSGSHVGVGLIAAALFWGLVYTLGSAFLLVMGTILLLILVDNIRDRLKKDVPPPVHFTWENEASKAARANDQRQLQHH